MCENNSVFKFSVFKFPDEYSKFIEIKESKEPKDFVESFLTECSAKGCHSWTYCAAPFICKSCKNSELKKCYDHMQIKESKISKCPYLNMRRFMDSLKSKCSGKKDCDQCQLYSHGKCDCFDGEACPWCAKYCLCEKDTCAECSLKEFFSKRKKRKLQLKELAKEEKYELADSETDEKENPINSERLLSL